MEEHDQRKALERCMRALEEIAEHSEALAAAGEPQNNIPEFARAILRGEDVHLEDFGDPAAATTHAALRDDDKTA